MRRSLFPALILLVVALACLGAAADRAAALSFATHVDYGVGSYPYLATTGDFNGDGHLDLCSADYDSSGVSVLLGNGDGTFDSARTFAIGVHPYWVAVGDFNGDYAEDLVTSNQAGTVTVLLGNGVGGFGGRTDVTVGANPYSVAVGDVNGDGKQDLVTANFTLDSVCVLLGDGAGGFTAKSVNSTADQPYCVIVVDVNADGKKDLAVSNFGGSCMGVFLGKGDGTFGARTDYTTAGRSLSVAAGDFNEDGTVDLVTGNNTSSYGASVFLGRGDGTFAPRADCASGVAAFMASVGDLDCDGHDDLAMATYSSGHVSLLRGAGNGTFQAAGSSDTWGYCASVSIGDFDEDGWPDLATANDSSNSLSVLINEGPEPAGTMRLSGGDAWTSGRGVALESDVTNAVEMRVRDAGGTWSEWRPYSASVYWMLATGDGAKTVIAEYRNSHGLTLSLSDQIGLDTTAPTASDDAPSGWQTASPVTVTLAGDDAGGSGVAELQYKVDDAATWTSGTSVGLTDDGGHAIRYRAVDVAGNKGDIESCTVKTDTTAPATTVSGADSGWQRYPVTLAFSAADATAGVARTEYSTDDGATWKTGTSLTVGDEGITTVSYRSIDVAGNPETAATCQVKVDVTDPTASDDAPSGWQTASPVTVTLEGDDGSGGSGVAELQSKVDDAATWTSGTSGATVPIAGDGVHSIHYRAVDVAGNKGDIESCTVKLDSADPVTTVFGADSAWHRYPVTLAVGAADATSGVARTEYSTGDGVTWTAGTSLTVKAEGETTVRYRSVDIAGRVEATHSVEVRIDTQGPATSIARARVRRGKTVTFRVKVEDAEPCSPDGARLKIAVKNRRGRTVAQIQATGQAVNTTSAVRYRCRLARGRYTCMVYAADAAGNTQRSIGTGTLIVR